MQKDKRPLYGSQMADAIHETEDGKRRRPPGGGGGESACALMESRRSTENLFSSYRPLSYIHHCESHL